MTRVTAREVKIVWALASASLVAILVTYSRLPASQRYHTTGHGLRAGLSRDVVELGFPGALVALAMLAVAQVDALAAAAARFSASCSLCRAWRGRRTSTRSGSTSCRLSASRSRSCSRAAAAAVRLLWFRQSA